MAKNNSYPKEQICILIDKEDELFIAVVDDEVGYAELRKNDKKPFGFPIEDIDQGDVFVITTDINPGTMYCRVDPGEIFRYTDILENKKLMDYLNEHYTNEISLIDLHKRVGELRDNKIDKIINNGDSNNCRS